MTKACDFTPILDDTLPHLMVWGGDNELSWRGTEEREGERERERKREIDRQRQRERSKDIICTWIQTCQRASTPQPFQLNGQINPFVFVLFLLKLMRYVFLSLKITNISM